MTGIDLNPALAGYHALVVVLLFFILIAIISRD